MRSRCMLRRPLLCTIGWLALVLQPGVANATVLAFDFDAAVDDAPGSKLSLTVEFSTIQTGAHFTDTVAFPGGPVTEVEGTGYAFDASSLTLLGDAFGELSGHTLTGGGGSILQRDGVVDADLGLIPDRLSYQATFGTDIGTAGTITLTAVIQDPSLELIVPSVVISRTIAPGLVITDTISLPITDTVRLASDALSRHLFLDFGGGSVITATITSIASRVVDRAIPEPRTPYILMTGLVLIGLLAHLKKRRRPSA